MRRTLIPAVVSTTVGVCATLIVQGRNVGALIAGILLLAIGCLYGAFSWVNPRLGFLPWLWLKQRQLAIGMVLLVAITVWLLQVTSADRWIISDTVDAVALLWFTALAFALVSYGANRTAPITRPRPIPRGSGSANLEYMGFTEDRVGRGSAIVDGQKDAEFQMTFIFGSSALRLLVSLIVLERISPAGRRLGEVWTSERLPSLWPLGVVDTETGVLLNPEGVLSLCSVERGSILRLFASDDAQEPEKSTAWFAPGQHYRATLILEGGLVLSATTSIPQA
jgi:hypothetical protein